MDERFELCEHGVAVLRLGGKVNMVTAAPLRRRLTWLVEEGYPRIVVDLGEVDFLDSSGLGALIGGLKAARVAGGDLRIAAVTEPVRRVLKLTNLDRVLAEHPTAESAFDAD
jgi:anti-sigma B factor antagonist